MTGQLDLTRQHFSTRVYKSYFYYIRSRHPGVNLEKLCSEAGLPLSYLLDEGNWVSVVFDQRFTSLLIQHTAEPNLCYKAGEQQISEEILGRGVYYLMKHALSAQFLYSQIGNLTSFFSKVTMVEAVSSKRDYCRLRLSPVLAGLDSDEAQALLKNLPNIMQNTLGHYAAVPTCQDLPPAHMHYQEYHNSAGIPYYEVDIRFVSSRKGFELLSAIMAVVGSVILAISGLSLIWVASFLGLASICIGISKFLHLRRGFSRCVNALNNMDQRYLELYEAKERYEKLSTSYSRFVPREFLKLLGRESILNVSLGDAMEADITVMFSDIRNFTALSEKISAINNFRLLNSYLQRISPLIGNNGGFIDKYMGDGIMALFPTSPRSAILAATAMVNELKTYNEHRRSSGYDPISIGIGLNYGKTILGTIGHPLEMSGTVISDCVNVAARLEKLGKDFGANILVSNETLRASGLAAEIRCRRLGKVAVRGKTQATDVYEIYEGSTESRCEALDKTKARFERAVDCLERREFDEAIALFQEVLAASPEDMASKYILNSINVMRSRRAA